MRANYGKPLRQWLKEKRIEEIVDFGDLPVFERATTYPCILRVSTGEPDDVFSVTHVDSLDFSNLQQYVTDNQFSVLQSELSEDGWALIDEQSQLLMRKIREVETTLGEYVENKIFFGIKTGLNKAFVIDVETRDSLVADDPKSAERIHPVLTGKEIKRYSPLNNKQYLILFEKGWTDATSANARNKWNWLSEEYPAISRHLEQFVTEAEKRSDQGNYWWELRTCDYYDAFRQFKIIFPDIAITGAFTIDKQGEYYCLNSGYIIPIADKYLLGILNSKLFSFYYINISSSFKGGYLRFFTQYLEKLPIRTIDFSDPADVARHDRMVTLVEQMLDLNRRLAAAKVSHEKEVLAGMIGTTDRQIDRLVYELYGLTEEEIAVVEGVE
jgi:hypothetical protein